MGTAGLYSYDTLKGQSNVQHYLFKPEKHLFVAYILYFMYCLFVLLILYYILHSLLDCSKLCYPHITVVVGTVSVCIYLLHDDDDDDEDVCVLQGGQRGDQ